MTNIITEIPSVVTTAELPDNIEIAIDGTSAEVIVMIGFVPIFQTTLFPYEGEITLYDLRAILEDYMKSVRHAIERVAIWVNDDAVEETFMSDDIYVAYSDFLIQDTASFFARHFLTTRSSFRIHRYGMQMLSWFAAAGESVGGYIDAVSLDAEIHRASGQSLHDILCDRRNAGSHHRLPQRLQRRRTCGALRRDNYQSEGGAQRGELPTQPHFLRQANGAHIRGGDRRLAL